MWVGSHKDFLVTKLIEGARRIHPSRDTREPISLPTLARLTSALPAVCSLQFEFIVMLFRAIFLSAFFGFMRVGKFAAKSKQYAQESVFSAADVQFCDLGTPSVSVTFTFRHTKTNQRGPPQSVWLVQSSDPQVCPVRALLDFVALRLKQAFHFFCHFDGRPVTQHQFNMVLKKTVQFVGLDNFRIRGHSFRIARHLGRQNKEPIIPLSKKWAGGGQVLICHTCAPLLSVTFIKRSA